MTRAFVILYALWAMVWIASIALPALGAAQGDGFTRGLNRIEMFFQLQALAAVLGVVLLMLRPAPRDKTTGRWRKIALIPLFLAGLLVLAVIAIILWVWLF